MATNPSPQNLDPKYDHYDFPTVAPESKSGHPGHTTKEQDAAVFQLRAMLEQEGYGKRLDTLTLVSGNLYYLGGYGVGRRLGRGFERVEEGVEGRLGRGLKG